MSSALEPGREVRPVIDHDGVRLLAERLYGISVLELEELNGYDDKNYRITEDPNVKNPLITEHSPDGYVLKIMNSMDSGSPALVEAQNEIMNYLRARNIVCPQPIRNVYGHLYSTESIAGRQHAVRLLRYVPGARLGDVPCAPPLLYQLGEFVAQLDNKLQNFNHSGLDGRQHIWMLSSVPQLDKFKFAVKDPSNLELAEEVIEEFKYAIVPIMDELEQGVIHGDINEMNVLVGPKPGGSKSEYRIEGIIDFGDVQRSCYVFELAVAMTYAALLARCPRAPGLVLAGHLAGRRLPPHEYRLLKTLISARLVQSLILGAYTLAQDPTNTYVNSTEKANGWEMLRRIRNARPDENGDDPTDWKTIANDYLTRS